MDDLVDSSSEPNKKRLRTSHACDVCRSRKIRCDGNKPCHACLNSKQECSYGSEANTRGKSDLILEGVLRVEELLQQMNLSMVREHDNRSLPSDTESQMRWSSDLLPSQITSPISAVPILQSPVSARPLSNRSPSIDDVHEHRQSNSNLENAILDSLHNSTTESILSWSHLDAFPTIRQNYTSIFQLEQSRPPLATRSNTMYPYISPVDLDAILDTFQRTVNFWYPVLSLSQLDSTRNLVVQNLLESTDLVTSCCAQLVMALGCAGEVVTGLVHSEDTAPGRDEVDFRRARKAMGDLYFDGALRAMHMVHSEMSCMAVQSLFFAALYFAYLRRPLQAWTYIHNTASKCLLLLSYPPVNEPIENQECLKRIFWACYILESDYLAELSALPQSGIAQIESSVSLPGSYITHVDPDQTEHASLYFLACISMRRLLNRVHHLLYARDTGAATDISRFPAIVTELDHQLEEWRDVLPHAFRFDIPQNILDHNDNNNGVPLSECGGFLRQRYLTCKSVIYRPYLAWLLASSPGGMHRDARGIRKEDIVARAQVCLDACTSHILALTGFAHTVLVDTWICALSMATAMMILLATRRSARKIANRHDMMETGPHLRKVFRRWQDNLGTPESPSVEQALRIIYETERLMSGLTGGKITEEEVDVANSMCAMRS